MGGSREGTLLEWSRAQSEHNCFVSFLPEQMQVNKLRCWRPKHPTWFGQLQFTPQGSPAFSEETKRDETDPQDGPTCLIGESKGNSFVLRQTCHSTRCLLTEPAKPQGVLSESQRERGLCKTARCSQH